MTKDEREHLKALAEAAGCRPKTNLPVVRTDFEAENAELRRKLAAAEGRVAMLEEQKAIIRVARDQWHEIANDDTREINRLRDKLAAAVEALQSIQTKLTWEVLGAVDGLNLLKAETKAAVAEAENTELKRKLSRAEEKRDTYLGRKAINATKGGAMTKSERARLKALCEAAMPEAVCLVPHDILNLLAEVERLEFVVDYAKAVEKAREKENEDLKCKLAAAVEALEVARIGLGGVPSSVSLNGEPAVGVLMPGYALRRVEAAIAAATQEES